MDKKHVSLVLEGGGAKCAYQVGAIIALEQLGYSFDAIVGSSFGALNGALYLMGGTQRLIDYYTNLTLKDIFLEDGVCDFVENYQGDPDQLTVEITKFRMKSPHFVKGRKEVSISYHNFLLSILNKAMIESSPIEYACTVLEFDNNPLLVGTLSLTLLSKNQTVMKQLYESNNIRGKYISKENGDIDKYIVASANYPTYEAYPINNYLYFDGGIFDNVPYKYFLEKGKENIVIIRTNITELKDFPSQNPNILVITPSRSVGNTANYKHDNLMANMEFGYTDTMNQLKDK